MKKPFHHHVKKHVIKHHKKYTRFLLYFLVLLTFGVFEDVAAIYITNSEVELIEAISVAIILSLVFTVIGEFVEELWEYEKKKFKY